MKQFIATIAAVAITVSATAQSLEEGMKMYRYERYTSAKKILQPLAATNATANYYYGMAELMLENTEAAKQSFAKFPDDYANISGMAMVKFKTEGETAGMAAAKSLADLGKKKDFMNKKFAADAVNYSDKGDKQQAVNWYNEVLEKMNTPELLIATGDAYLQIPSGGGQAMTHYEKAIEKDPKNSLAYSRIGKLMYQAKNYEVALENWKKANEADPTNPLPYYDMANAYTFVRKFDLAKQNMEKYMEYSDKSTEDQIRYAEILYQSEDYDKAIEIVSDLKNKGVQKVNLYGLLGYSYAAKKDSASTVKALENLNIYFEKQDPAKHTARDFMSLGQVQARANKAEEANKSFAKALEKETPENKVNVYRDIAEGFRLNRNWVSGAEWYEKLITDFADKATANDYYWGGICYYYSASNSKNVDGPTQLNKAVAMFDKMIAKFPEQQIGYYWRARSYAALDPEGEKGLAVADFEKWLTMDVEAAKKADKLIPFAYQYLTASYYHKEDKTNALKYADEVLKLDPNNQFGKQVKEYFNKKG